MFDEAPKEGDQVTVTGTVKSVNADTGEVDVSYDKVVNSTEESGESSDQDNSEDGGNMRADEALDNYMKNKNEE